MNALKPGLLALACALLLVGTHQATQSVIAENRAYFEQQQLRDMAGELEVSATADQAYLLLAQDEPVGKISPVTTTAGYNGRIDLLVAWRFSGEIINVRVTRHQETPGIGDVIELPVSDWILGFNGQTFGETKWSLSPGGDIDGITGATITARAVTDAVASVQP